MKTFLPRCFVLVSPSRIFLPHVQNLRTDRNVRPLDNISRMAALNIGAGELPWWRRAWSSLCVGLDDSAQAKQSFQVIIGTKGGTMGCWGVGGCPGKGGKLLCNCVVTSFQGGRCGFLFLERYLSPMCHSVSQHNLERWFRGGTEWFAVHDCCRASLRRLVWQKCLM